MVDLAELNENKIIIRALVRLSVVSARKRKSTETSSFGVSKREGHDSSKFYGRKLYANRSSDAATGQAPEQMVPAECLDTIFCKSSEKMDEIPDSCIHLAVTSPPYNVGKTYDKDLTLDEYRQLLKKVLSEVFRVLVSGGRICVNVANLGRKPYIPLHHYIIEEMLDIGFLMRGEIIWNKGSSAGTSTAWGSWKSATNPSLRDTHEYVLVFSKESYGRSGKANNTITKDEFLKYTKSVWEFPAESAKRTGHPAPFPVELPHRCVQLYSFEGDVVLDPFCGIGSTCVAAKKAGRHFIGYDNNESYVEEALRRIQSSKRE